jgi:hypothetical protein
MFKTLIEKLIGCLKPMLVVSVLLVAACSTTPSGQTFEGKYTLYDKTTLPAKHMNDATFVETAMLRFQINEFGDRIYKENPRTGEIMPLVAGIEYANTYIQSAQLQLAVAILPGLMSIGGQVALSQMDCNGCSGGGGVSILNINENQARGLASINAQKNG